MTIRPRFALLSFGIAIGMIAACGGGTTGTPDAGGDSSAGGSSSSGGGGSSSGGSSVGGPGGDAGLQLPGTAGTGPLAGCGGAGTCMSPDVCCPGGGGGGGGGGDTCAPLSTCANSGGDIYTCTSQANCASGTLCCVVRGTGGNPDIASCQPSCAGARTSQVCQTGSECPSGLVCQNSGNVALTTCGPVFTIDSGAGTGPIACGTTTCTAPQLCCAQGGGSSACSTANTCDTGGGDVYSCTGQANCPGGVCCVTAGATPGGNDLAVCQSTCTGMGTTAQVCQTSSECPAGSVCQPGRGFAMAICRPSPDAGTTPVDAGADAAPAIREAAVDGPGGG